LQDEPFNRKRRQLLSYERRNMLSFVIICHKLLQHGNFHLAYYVAYNMQLLKAF